jgi:hypothetical protein
MHLQPGAAPQAFIQSKTGSAESAIHFRRQLAGILAPCSSRQESHPPYHNEAPIGTGMFQEESLSRAFSACFHANRVPGALPQAAMITAPLAPKNAYPKTRLQFILTIKVAFSRPFP